LQRASANAIAKVYDDVFVEYVTESDDVTRSGTDTIELLALLDVAKGYKIEVRAES